MTARTLDTYRAAAFWALGLAMLAASVLDLQ